MDIATTKAYQGANLGISGMKGRIRSHFWFPELNQKVKGLINSCKECQLFTHENTKKPLITHDTSKEAWQDVSINLFGPMPDQKHVVVVLDKIRSSLQQMLYQVLLQKHSMTSTPALAGQSRIKQITHFFCMPKLSFHVSKHFCLSHPQWTMLGNCLLLYYRGTVHVV